MTTKVNNIYEYKRALQIKKDLEAVTIVFEKFLRESIPYMKYTLVADAYRAVNDNHLWAKLYIKDQDKIIESKGTEGTES